MRIINFAPVPSTVPYLTSTKPISLIMGPIGSTKTTVSLFKLAYHASKIAPCPDGIRRSRAMIVRNTIEQLKDSTIPDFLQWFPDKIAGEWLKSERRFILKFSDVECEVLFRSLDTPADVRKVLSTQLTFVFMDEFRELPRAVFEGLQGRLRRYPSRKLNGVGAVDDEGNRCSFLWGCSNPPDMDTFWEKFLTNPPDDTHVTIQPSGLSPEADWVGPPYVDTTYYKDLAVGKSPMWVSVYIEGKFGQSQAGEPVHSSFRRTFHVSPTPLNPIPMSDFPIICSFDFGLMPACIIGQRDHMGRLNVLGSLWAENKGLSRFIVEDVRPFLLRRCPGFKIVATGDPAGRQRASNDERTAYDILKAFGIESIPAHTNSIVARLNAVDELLCRHIEGRAAILFDPVDCEMIITALMGGYRFRRKKNGEIEDTPDKSSKFSHVADALQYLCLFVGASGGSSMKKVQRRQVDPYANMGYVV